MGAPADIQGSPQWQTTFLLLAVLWLLFSTFRGWTNGLMRQLMGIVAFLVATFLVVHFTGDLAAYLHLEVTGIFQTPIAALLLWIISCNGVVLIGRVLFKRTRDQDSLPVRTIFGAGGALVGLIYGLFFIWCLLIGVRVIGRIAKNQIEMERDASQSSGELVMNLAKLKNSVELGIGRLVVDAVDPAPPAFYRELDRCSRLIGNPRVIQKMLDYPGFRRVLQDPKIADLRSDPEILADLQSGNVLGVFANRKVVALLNDSELRQAFSPSELEAALDYAGNTASDNENPGRE
jgi:hypothetical protein